jgi:NADPH2:quinone reductase
MQLVKKPKPVIAGNELLIKVMAAGVNRPDIAQRKGHYPAPVGVAADVPGLEVAGVVEEVGNACVRYKVGDRICALLAGGGYADYCAVPELQCLPIPSNLSFIEGASLPETFFTVWSNVFDRGKLREGETFLVHGGTSGIGVTAIQMAKAMGAKVFTTAGTDEKCSFCRELGADVAINYKKEKFWEVIRAATDGRGVDVILDMVGGEYTPRHLEVLAEEGRLVLINFMGGDETPVRLSAIMRKRLTITGSTLRARSAEFKGEIAANVERVVWPMLESGKIKPVIHATFQLDEAAEAHQLMESGGHMGKIILVV